METRLRNIFETKNTMTLTETILESASNVLLGSGKTAIIKQPLQISKTVQF